MNDDKAAKALFDAMPHAHPQGHVPDWEMQPEAIKDAFRGKARGKSMPAEVVKPEAVPPDMQLINGPEWYVTGAQVLWGPNDPIIMFNKIIPAVPPAPPPGTPAGTQMQGYALVAPVGLVRLSGEALKDLAAALQIAVEVREQEIGKPIETDSTRQQAAAKKK
jgi:hypothetical protein